jgi:hypothetical protein
VDYLPEAEMASETRRQWRPAEAHHHRPPAVLVSNIGADLCKVEHWCQGQSRRRRKRSLDNLMVVGPFTDKEDESGWIAESEHLSDQCSKPH